MTSNVKSRIYVASHGTQLLVIQHLRQHCGLPPAREYLAWNPQPGANLSRALMESVVSTAGFTETILLDGLESMQARRHGSAAWWFESARRLRSDVKALRLWLEERGIVESELELWSDEPIHFNVQFLKALLRNSVQIKFPHCFNLEDSNSAEYRLSLVQKARSESWAKRIVFWRWLRWMSGCDFRPTRVLAFDVAYTFDAPSTWAPRSEDVSELVSLSHFAETYATLPGDLKAGVEAMIAPLRASGRPLILLLLFGLDSISQGAYRRALARIFLERAAQLEGCSLVIKVHPGANGEEEERLLEWVRTNIPAQIFPIRSPLNLEFMLPQLQPDYVLAGPCGALPVVARLGVGRPVVLPEIMDVLCARFPADRQGLERVVEGMEAW